MDLFSPLLCGQSFKQSNIFKKMHDILKLNWKRSCLDSKAYVVSQLSMALWMVHTSPLLNMLAFLMRTITITSMRATQLFVRLLWITWSCLLVCLWHFLDSQITIHKFFASLCFMFKPNIMGYLVHKEATKMELPFICWQKIQGGTLCLITWWFCTKKGVTLF